MAATEKQRFFFGLTGTKLQRAQIWAVIMPAYILFGYNQGIAGPLLDLQPFIETFPQVDTLTTTGSVRSQNSRIQGTIVALYALGCFFGSLSTIFFGDKIGRIRTIQAGAVGTIIGAAIQSTPFSLAQLIVGRLLVGVGYGAVTATAPNWQSECALAEHRGAAVLFESVFISMGLAIGGWIELGMSFTADGATPAVSWRFALALPAFFALIVLCVVPLFPESPRWLLKHGRRAEAVAALSALAGAPASSAQVQMAVSEVEESLKASGTLSFRSILTNGPQRVLHRTWLAATGQLFQQMTGVNALAFFQATVFQQYLGFDGVSARVMAASAFTWQTVCSPIGVLTVDRFGRRKLMLVSAAGMGICMAIIAGAGSRAIEGDRGAAGAAAVFIFLFSTFFPTGFLGLTFLYAAEVAPLAARVPVTAISTATAWLFNFVVGEISPVGVDNLSWRYYLVYAALNIGLIFPVVYFCFPETAGRHLEEVDEIFAESKNIFQTVAVARRMPRRGLAVVTVEDAFDSDDGKTMMVDGEKAERVKHVEKV